MSAHVVALGSVSAGDVVNITTIPPSAQMWVRRVAAAPPGSTSRDLAIRYGYIFETVSSAISCLRSYGLVERPLAGRHSAAPCPVILTEAGRRLADTLAAEQVDLVPAPPPPSLPPPIANPNYGLSRDYLVRLSSGFEVECHSATQVRALIAELERR
jgi:hypothetical protein